MSPLRNAPTNAHIRKHTPLDAQPTNTRSSQLAAGTGRGPPSHLPVSVNDTASARELMANLPPGLQRLIGRTVCVADSVKEPRLRQLVALQEFSRALAMQMVEGKLKLAGGGSWNIGAEAEARNKRPHAYVLGSQAGGLISAGPQCPGPEPDKVTGMFQWLKAPYLEGEQWKQTAVHHTKAA